MRVIIPLQKNWKKEEEEELIVLGNDEKIKVVLKMNMEVRN
jgi:hypothetical protein